MVFFVVAVTVQNVNQHFLSVGSGLYECGVCGQTTSDKSNMKRHLIIKHAAPTNDQCQSCQRVFRNRYYLLDHLRSKLCQCKSSWIHISAYVNFIRTREDTNQYLERQFDGNIRCMLCGKVGKDRSNMRKHVIIMHARPTYESCPYCPKTFGNVYYLRYHVKSCPLNPDWQNKNSAAAALAAAAAPLWFAKVVVMLQERTLCNFWSTTFRTVSDITSAASVARRRITRATFRDIWCWYTPNRPMMFANTARGSSSIDTTWTSTSEPELACPICCLTLLRRRLNK